MLQRTAKRTMQWQVILFSIFSLSPFSFGQIHYSLLEEIKQGTVVGNIATDLGLNIKDLAGRKLQFSSNTKKHYVNINMANGDLYVTDRIDRETICGAEQSCFLHLEIVAQNPVSVFHVKIEIQDVNDNAPSFSKNVFEVAISESASIGTRFILSNARDPDLGTNALQSYGLSPNQHFKLGEKINAEGFKYPELVLEKSVDREKQSTYELTVNAYDGGKSQKTGTALIKIVVLDVNDNFPVFNQDTYRISLNENTPINFVFLHLNATDEDEGSNAEITYSFSHIPINAVDIFTLDFHKGDIKTTGELDFETTRSYEITVEAKDGGGLASHCTVLIQILDVNDNAPEIILASLSTPISEDSTPGTLIALINVKDLDSGPNGEVNCHMTEQLDFKLIPSSSNYYQLVTTSLDREAQREYNITLTAEDQGSPPLVTKKNITLIVSDVNDNPPVFDEVFYTVYVSEHNHPGTSIVTVHASDQDDKENAGIIYSIINTNIENIPASSYISINSMTGSLYAQRSFDYEELREFHFKVMAKDSGSPSLSSNVTVRVCIIDKNDNAPKIIYPSSDTEGTVLFEFIPRSAEKGYLVTKVIAVDADSGHNAWLSYHFLQASEQSLFTIGKHNGEIRIGRDLQDMDLSRQNIVVLVKDNGVPSLSSTATLSLVVAENFQQVSPDIRRQPSNIDSPIYNVKFYLIVSIAVITLLFIVTVMIIIISKCRKTNLPSSVGALSKNMYPQFTMGCPSEISDGTLPFPFSYDVCVTLDSKQNEIAYLKTVQNVPTDTLIDTGVPVVGVNGLQNGLSLSNPVEVRPNKEFDKAHFFQLANPTLPSSH